MLVISAIILQRLEYHHTERSSNANLVNFVKNIRKEQLINSSGTIVAKLREFFNQEEENQIREKFKSIGNAYLFTLTSFTALGEFCFKRLLLNTF